VELARRDTACERSAGAHQVVEELRVAGMVSKRVLV